MIDFVKLVYVHNNINAFLKVHEDQLKGIISLGTGELEYPLKIQIEGNSIEINESKVSHFHYINIKGSLHKNHFIGANWQRFTFENMRAEVKNLCSLLHLDPEKLVIKNLEIGVNIRTKFKPFEYLDENLLLYKTKKFTKYDQGKDGKVLGFYCVGLPVVKIYDKGLQFDLPYNLLRFELRFKKSAVLRKLGILSIHDLLDVSKFNSLSIELLKAWDNILLYESDLNTAILTAKDKTLYRELEHPKNWIKKLRQSRSRQTYYDAKNDFKRIIELHGKNVHKVCKGLILEEIEKCTKFPCIQGHEVDNFTNTLKGNIVHHEKIRTCLSCGKELHPNQRAISKFCSEKYVGKKEGKKCRNFNSNNRNSAKKKIRRVENNGLLFPVNEILNPSVLTYAKDENTDKNSD